MYTQLKLEELKKVMKKYVSMVFAYANKAVGKKGEKVLRVKARGTLRSPWYLKTEAPGDKDNVKIVTPERLMEWIEHLLDNLYIQVGDKIVRQKCGIPMGTSCSPFLANLMLFMYELEAVTDIISKTDILHEERRRTIWKLAQCTRYIDDLWNPLISKRAFMEITKRMYPKWLSLGEPEHEGNAVNYMDMTIWWDGKEKKWQSKLYDKKDELVHKGLKINKFPHPESILSENCKCGVITSQLHRYNAACTRNQDIIPAARKLHASYIHKGYDVTKINKYFNRFLLRHAHGREGKTRVCLKHIMAPERRSC